MKHIKLFPNAMVCVGMGVTTSLGTGVEENWRNLLDGKSGTKVIERFGVAGLKTMIGATVDKFDYPRRLTNPERTALMAEEVIKEALTRSGIDLSKHHAETKLFYATHQADLSWQERIALSRALYPDAQALTRGPALTTAVMLDSDVHRRSNSGSYAFRLADRFGIGGGVTTVTTACASGATAIGLALDALRSGECQVAVVVGADACICEENITRFSLLSALSTENDAPTKASKPFDKHRDGFVMGEGAGCILLMRPELASDHDYPNLGYVLGYGSATDSYHKTRSNPTGERIVACMQRALNDAGLSPLDIDCINAHGTSTTENDKMESLGIQLLFGEKGSEIPVTSNKSMIGHTLCASGVVEAIFSLLSVEHQIIPPTINFEHPDDSIGVNVIANVPMKRPIATVLSNSFGFGGQNVSVVIGRRTYG